MSRRHVDLLAQLAIVDVDVAADYVEGQLRATERDHGTIILAGSPARRFGFQRFCAAFVGTNMQPPAIIQITDRGSEQLPCSLVPEYRIEADFDREDLRRAVWTAVERTGNTCEPAGLCGRHSFRLAPTKCTPH